MNTNFLKIALKTEIKNLSKKTLFLVLVCLITPFIFYHFVIIKENSQLNDSILKIIILFSLTMGIFQYFLDSTTNDILSKINVFYSNLNISRIYPFVSKILICTPFAMLFIICNLLFFKITLLPSFGFIIFLLCINICIYTYLIVYYFFNSNSLLFSTYVSMFFTIGLSLLTVLLLNSTLYIVLNIILQITIMLIALFLLKKIFKTKKLIIKIL